MQDGPRPAPPPNGQQAPGGLGARATHPYTHTLTHVNTGGWGAGAQDPHTGLYQLNVNRRHGGRAWTGPARVGTPGGAGSPPRHSQRALWLSGPARPRSVYLAHPPLSPETAELPHPRRVHGGSRRRPRNAHSVQEQGRCLRAGAGIQAGGGAAVTHLATPRPAAVRTCGCGQAQTQGALPAGPNHGIGSCVGTKGLEQGGVCPQVSLATRLSHWGDKGKCPAVPDSRRDTAQPSPARLWH